MPQSNPAATFKRRLLRRLAKAAAQQSKRLIPSRTLRNAMLIAVHNNLSRVWLIIPHFWALYVHDGRGPFGPRRSKVLVWFEDPKDDPRTNFGRQYPVRYTDVKRLSREQFKAGMRENRRRRAQGDFRPYMIVTKRAKGTPGTFFFSKGLDGFDRVAAPIVRSEFERLVRLSIFSDKDSVRAVL